MNVYQAHIGSACPAFHPRRIPDIVLNRPSALIACAAALGLLTTSAANADAHEDKPSVTMTPPDAEQREHTYTHHGITISDPYDWLYDKSYPEIDDEDVLDYVKAENAYFEAQMEPQAELTEALFTENKVLQYIVSLNNQSEHPLAEATVKYGKGQVTGETIYPGSKMGNFVLSSVFYLAAFSPSLDN